MKEPGKEKNAGQQRSEGAEGERWDGSPAAPGAMTSLRQRGLSVCEREQVPATLGPQSPTLNTSKRQISVF